MLDLLACMETGQFTEIEQDHTLATRAPKLSRERAQIDWFNPAEQIARQIRGMHPWPGCHAHLLDAAGKPSANVLMVRARAISGSGTPGTILSNRSVATGSGALEIVEIQPEGKRAMPLAAFVNGHPWHAGMVLKSK
jgi:methionyl-tRNA formyltransferase